MAKGQQKSNREAKKPKKTGSPQAARWFQKQVKPRLIGVRHAGFCYGAKTIVECAA